MASNADRPEPRPAKGKGLERSESDLTRIARVRRTNIDDARDFARGLGKRSRAHGLMEARRRRIEAE